MADEEKNDAAEETPKDETVEAAGPVAEGDPPADSPEDQPSTPPAEEESETDGDTPTAEEEAEKQEAPADEAEAPADEDQGESAGASDEVADATDDDSGEDAADDDWKAKRRLERSRLPHEAKPQRSPEERDKGRQEQRGRLATARRKRRETAKAKKGEARTGTPPAERQPNAAKVRQGIVVSDRADKTITVRIDTAHRHPAYEKIVRRSNTLHAHDERNEAGPGDTVRVVETRPLSKTKRWRLVQVVEKAK